MEGSTPERGSRLPRLRTIVAVLLVAGVIWFALDNRQRVTIDWWVTERESRLIYVVVISALLGAISDRLLGRWRRGRSK
ncbi:MAG: hypothetical protein IT201_12895 [Thermoleophilia bacterium]|nr:hypothetical protein [Thermoleophilia bacterium]